MAGTSLFRSVLDRLFTPHRPSASGVVESGRGRALVGEVPNRSRWVDRASGRFFALCWMLAMHLAVVVPMTIATRSVRAQPTIPRKSHVNGADVQYNFVYLLGAEEAPGVRPFGIVYVDRETDASMVSHAGHFQTTQETIFAEYTPTTDPEYFEPGSIVGAMPGLTPVSYQMTMMRGFVVPDQSTHVAAFEIVAHFGVSTWRSTSGELVSHTSMFGALSGGASLTSFARANLRTMPAPIGGDVAGSFDFASNQWTLGYWKLIATVVTIGAGYFMGRSQSASATRACNSLSETHQINCLDLAERSHCTIGEGHTYNTECCLASIRCCNNNHLANARGCQASSSYSPVNSASTCVYCD